MENQTLKIIENLMQKNNLTANKLVLACKLQNNTFTYWKNGKTKPTIDALIKIADYFNVSIDYLVGREISQEQKANNVTTDPLLIKINNLNELQRAKVEAYIDGLQSDTKALFNQGRLIAREKQIAEENSKQKKQI